MMDIAWTYFRVKLRLMRFLYGVRRLLGVQYTHKNIMRGLTSEKIYIRQMWADDDRCPVLEKYVNIGITDKSPYIRLMWTIRRFDCTPEQLMIGVTDSLESIRLICARKVENLEVAPNDEVIRIGLSDIEKISNIWRSILVARCDMILESEEDDDPSL